jgi:hypothetical protein
VGFTVEDVAPVAEVVSRVPIEADVLGGQGGGLILFVNEGRISSLEYWSVDDERPTEFPPRTESDQSSSRSVFSLAVSAVWEHGGRSSAVRHGAHK